MIVGWIGLGEMGLPMAARLVRAGHVVRGFDVDPQRLRAAETAGVEATASLAATVADATAVVTMLRTAAQTEDVLTAPGGLADLAGVDAPLDVIVMSTLDPASLRNLARATAPRLSLVDAPVSGGAQGAIAGTLAIMAAGPESALARVQPLFDVLGARTFAIGTDVGDGQAAKLANQVMMAAAIAGTFEALGVARAHGVDECRVREAVLAGTGASWVLEHWAMLRRLWESYVPGNALDILVKDTNAVLADGAALGLDLPVTALALTRLLEAPAAAQASPK